MALAAAIFVLMALAIYIASNPLAAPVVQGLQGRYFIPVLLPVLLAAMFPRAGASPFPDWLIASLLMVANAVSLVAIAEAFYTG